MSSREIVLWPDTRLSKRCDEIEEIGAEVRALAEDMLETMYAAPGRGLAAPQVGVLTRLFVMDVDWKDAERNPQVFINPEIVAQSDETKIWSEGCLSIPGIMVDVSRPEAVELVWKDLGGNPKRARFDGFAAVCAQHELDHLNGVVTLDHVKEETRAQLISDYEKGRA